MKKLNVILGTLVTALFVSACASKTEMQASSVVPAAKGEIVTKATENDNTQLTVRVKHLAPAERIDSAARNYVVWIQPSGESSFQNIGALRVNDELQGEYSTTTPHRNFRVMVTPEPSTTVASPSGVTIFDESVSS